MMNVYVVIKEYIKIMIRRLVFFHDNIIFEGLFDI
jgi:hypothetical protein